MLIVAPPRLRPAPRRVLRDGVPDLSPGERALFALLLALSLAAVWAFRCFPSQDGPIHLEIAGILRRLAAGGPPAFARFFEVNREPEPNWLVYLPLTALMSALTPLAAEKVLLSGYLLLLPAALLYGMRSVRPEAAWLAMLGFPLLASFPFHMGFYNYCYGLGLMLVALGFWLRRRHRMRLAATAALAGLLLAVSLAHPVALAAAGLAVGCVAAAEARAAPAGERLRTLLRLGLPPLAAALPALAPIALFVGEEGTRDYVRLPARVLVRHLATLYSLVSYSRAELAVSLGFLLLLAALAWAARRRGAAGSPEGPHAGPLSTGLGAFALLLSVVYFAAPQGLAGGGYLNQRLQIPLLLAVLLWLASRPGTDRLRRPGVALAALLSLGALGLHARAYAQLAPQLAEYRSVGARLPAGATLLSLSFAHRGLDESGGPLALRIRPFQHAAGYLSAERGVVDLNNYQADRGYFPVRYRRECNPFGPLGTIDEIEEEPPRVHLGRYRRALAAAGCGDVDYLLLWGLDPAARTGPAAAALLAEIEAGYRPVYVSRPRGLARLYRRDADF